MPTRGTSFPYALDTDDTFVPHDSQPNPCAPSPPPPLNRVLDAELADVAEPAASRPRDQVDLVTPPKVKPTASEPERPVARPLASLKEKLAIRAQELREQKERMKRPSMENSSSSKRSKTSKGATSAPMDATGAPMDETSAPMDATSAPMDETSAAMDATSAPKDATSAPKDATSAPMDATSVAMDATSAAMDATSVAMDATSAAMDATSVAMDATSAAMDATSVANPKVGKVRGGKSRTKAIEGEINSILSDSLEVEDDEPVTRRQQLGLVPAAKPKAKGKAKAKVTAKPKAKRAAKAKAKSKGKSNATNDKVSEEVADLEDSIDGEDAASHDGAGAKAPHGAESAAASGSRPSGGGKGRGRGRGRGRGSQLRENVDDGPMDAAPVSRPRKAPTPTTPEEVMDLLQDNDLLMRIVLEMIEAHTKHPLPEKDDPSSLPSYNHWMLSIYWTRNAVGVLRRNGGGKPIYCGSFGSAGFRDLRVPLEAADQFASRRGQRFIYIYVYTLHIMLYKPIIHMSI